MSSVSSRAAPVATEPPNSDLTGDADRLRQLDRLRAELDQIDDALHDTLMRRAELVAQVGSLGAKGRVPLRPGREASILARLLGRNRGKLAPATLVRVWREMLSGSSAQQSPMRVVVGDAGLMPTMCEHFGALMTADVVSPAAAIEQVAEGRAAVAVMPMPGDGMEWWTGLLDERWRGVHVVARLPFWSRKGATEALVLSAAAPDPSGDDRTLIAGPGGDRELARAGSVVLAEIDGLVTAEELRARGIAATVLGAYAKPVGDVE